MKSPRISHIATPNPFQKHTWKGMTKERDNYMVKQSDTILIKIEKEKILWLGSLGSF